MIKTKKEILHNHLTDSDTITWIEGDEDPIIDAMDEYAAQVLGVYKENLKTICSYLKLKDEEEACNGAWNQAVQTIIGKI